MPETMNLAKRLKEQKKQESEITESLMRQQLADMRQELTSTLQKELNTIKNDINAQTESIAWSTFKSRLLWPWVTGVFLCLGILSGSWAALDYFTNKAITLSQSIEVMEKEGGKVQWNYCGEKRRLCVKIDQKATPYGKNGEWRIVEGY